MWIAREEGMKKAFVLVLVIALLLPVFTVGALYAQHEHAHCEEWETGRDFGQYHAEHAREGTLGKDHNPGHHQGYSPCVP
jgi:hypothetical protein